MTIEDRLDFTAGGLGRSTALWFGRTVTLGTAGAAILALAGLLGYVPGLRVLGSIRLDYIPMASSTAVCFLILSVALFRHARKPWRGSGLMAMVALVLLVTVFSLLLVVARFAGMDLGFESRLVLGAGAFGKIPVGRMSPATGVAFIAAGLSTCLLLLRSQSSRHVHRLGHWASSLGFLTALIGATVLLAYLYGAPFMYRGATIPMAATTAIAFLFLGMALVAAVGPESFVMSMISGDSISARLSRAFIPLTVAVVIIQSVLSRFAAAAPLVNDALLLAVLVVVMGTITAFVIAQVARLIGNNLDELNRKLRASEEWHRTILQTAMDGIWLLDTDGRLLEVNETYCRMSGYSVQELLAMRIPDLDAVESPGDTAARILKIVAQGEDRFESRHRRKDGSMFEVEVSVQYRPTEGGRFVAFIHDITERKRAEAERERLAVAFEQLAEIVVITDTRGMIQYVNPAFESVTGYTRTEAIGQHPRILKSGQHDAAFYRELWETISSGKIWQGRFVNRKKNGALYTEEATISPVRDAAGGIANYVAVKRDITEDLNLQAQLTQAQKMESVGRLAGGVAHDFNNILQIILGNAQLAAGQVGPGDPVRLGLEEIQSAAQRAADLTRQLLAFASRQVIAPRTLDLNETVEGMLDMLRHLIGENIELIWTPRAVLWPIRMDPSQADQILANLCVNARDAIDGVGKVHIATENVHVDELHSARYEEFPPGDYVLLLVSDTGCGMDKVTQGRIFEPFFTTKAMGKGVGLGLATVYGIVRQNHGHVGVYSEPGKGTTFRIHLPRHLGANAAQSAEGPAKPSVRGCETVLLVEDDAAILNMIGRTLRGLGYTVLAAATPEAALRLAEEHGGEIRILVTDIVMPGMNGRELAERIRAAKPGIKCLFMSGFTADVIANHGVLDEGVQFIQKPFVTADLTAKIRETLAGT